ncbi:MULTISPECIES: LysR family transcriptional regulator [unclassified Bradyrhizobium]|nr:MULTISPECIES: LysR family transcriptional regulator [unclassified Bradyrhizobium]MCK1484369.1 LysR family transcriptional regulator [Bradyrhizobium sp. 193]MCK1581921.1 LysR family transcriptional regulator [Bradyrhizobium sp. 168]UPJ92330.1 LysR family transcriptional regulator [Bradyrhizobium sp. 183]UPK00220.1 LysR family transcriptional regulator [Bradyrhizobium sp. 172]
MQEYFRRWPKSHGSSQPALSQAVQQIEKRFGVAIVLRHQSWISNAFAAP